MSHMACFASFASISEPVLAFWQSDSRCRLNGNMNGPMKTVVGPAGPRILAVSKDYMSGRVHLGRTYTIGILDRLVRAGAGTKVLLLVYQ